MNLISEKSALSKIYEKISDENIKFSIEALTIVIRMINVSYSRLVSLLERYERSISEEVFMQNWLVIGNLNRLRCLIGQLPGIKKNEPWFQLFFKKIRDVENPRNLIEHYDKQLRELILKVRPTLGYICWLGLGKEKEFYSKLASIGIIRKYKNLEMINPAGKIMRFKIDHVTYFLGDAKLNISNFYYDLAKFTQNLERYVKNKYS